MKKNLFKNWKTTSAGLTLIIGAVIHIVFLVTKQTPITEAELMLAVGAILGGVGMLAAGDADKKADKEELKQVKEVVRQVPHAIATGNTEFLNRAIEQPSTKKDT